MLCVQRNENSFRRRPAARDSRHVTVLRSHCKVWACWAKAAPIQREVYFRILARSKCLPHAAPCCMLSTLHHIISSMAYCIQVVAPCPYTMIPPHLRIVHKRLKGFRRSGATPFRLAATRLEWQAQQALLPNFSNGSKCKPSEDLL